MFFGDDLSRLLASCAVVARRGRRQDGGQLTVFALQQVLLELLLPPLGPFLLLLLALAIARRFRRTAWALAAVAVLAQSAAGSVGMFAYANAPWPAVPESVQPPYPAAEAIVVLGGGRYLNAPEYGGDTAGPSTLERVRYAAKLQRETGQPILVSGGRPGDIGERSEAAIMRDILEDEFGVAVTWTETRSEDTAGNARLSAQILHDAGIRRIYLVTHGAHSERATEAFRQQGLQVVPMITGFVRAPEVTATAWLPSLTGFNRSRLSLVGWLASLKLRLASAATPSPPADSPTIGKDGETATATEHPTPVDP